MRLNPIRHPTHPDYPDLDAYKANRRTFLQRLGIAAGAAILGAAGCNRDPERLAGSIRAVDPDEGTPPEHLPGAVAEPAERAPRNDPGSSEASDTQCGPAPEEHLPGAPPPPTESTPPDGSGSNQGVESHPERVRGRMASPHPPGPDH